MTYICVSGDISKVTTELSKYMSRQNVDVLLSKLLESKDILSTDEQFSVDEQCEKATKCASDSDSLMGFIIPKTNYYINIKTTTLLTLCLVFDITLNCAFPNLNPLLVKMPGAINGVLALLGVTPNAHKITDIQRHVIQKIVLSNEKKCTKNEIYDCENKKQRKKIDAAINELLNHGIIKFYNGEYSYVF